MFDWNLWVVKEREQSIALPLVRCPVESCHSVGASFDGTTPTSICLCKYWCFD